MQTVLKPDHTSWDGWCIFMKGIELNRLVVRIVLAWNKTITTPYAVS